MLLSSVCGIFGNAGQANYAAGNTYQDALARYRVSIGERATSIDLGPVLDEGWVAEADGMMEKLGRLEILRPTSLVEIFAMLDYYCNPAQSYDISQSQAITGIRMPEDVIAKKREAPAAVQVPLFRHAFQIKSSNTGFARTDKKSLASEFLGATSSGDACMVVSTALKERVSRLLGLSHEQVRVDQSLASYGIDSLLGLELRNWLAKETRADIAVFEILGGASLNEIGELVVSKSAIKLAGWNTA